MTLQEKMEHMNNAVINLDELDDSYLKVSWQELKAEINKPFTHGINKKKAIKPCPFCGSNKINFIPNDPWMRLQCSSCFAVGRPAKIFPVSHSTEEIIDSSIKAWNDRWQELKANL